MQSSSRNKITSAKTHQENSDVAMPKNINGEKETSKSEGSGKRLHNFIRKLYPICRSITGDGLRKTLQIIKQQIPIQIKEWPTGTRVYDWTIPNEWNIREAWIKDSKGEKIIDFSKSNLHVLNYSLPVNQRVSFGELEPHLYTDPDQPDLIPYRTSYYKKQWGFCLAHNQLMELDRNESYHVFIDSMFTDGSMSFGELCIQGKTTDEVLISSHVCHPSLCNDNLSGISVAVYLARYLLEKEPHYSYRFLFMPATIGAIAWLAHSEEHIDKVKHGLVLSCLGDKGNVTYKRSRRGQAEIDRIAEYVLSDSGDQYDIRPFSPCGYDERQFCSPGFNLPVGCFMRTPFGEFSEYHTSADDLTFVKPEALADSLSKLKKIIDVIEDNGTYLNLNPKGEPNLGKRGLYSLTGGNGQSEINQQAVLWVLNYADGMHSLLDITEKSGLSFRELKQAAAALLRVDLLKRLC